MSVRNCLGFVVALVLIVGTAPHSSAQVDLPPTTLPPLPPTTLPTLPPTTLPPTTLPTVTTLPAPTVPTTLPAPPPSTVDPPETTESTLPPDQEPVTSALQPVIHAVARTACWLGSPTIDPLASGACGGNIPTAAVPLSSSAWQPDPSAQEGGGADPVEESPQGGGEDESDLSGVRSLLEQARQDLAQLREMLAPDAPTAAPAPEGLPLTGLSVAGLAILGLLLAGTGRLLVQAGEETEEEP